MDKNKVKEFIDIPLYRKAIGNKWVFKVKRKENGSIDKFKAHLVVNGYTQRVAIDHGNTFSPMVRFASIRLRLAVVAKFDLELFQMDEEVYMDQPNQREWA